MDEPWWQTVRSQVAWHLRAPWGRVTGPILLGVGSVTSGGVLVVLLAGGAAITFVSEVTVHRHTKHLEGVRVEGIKREIRQHLADSVDVINDMSPSGNDAAQVRACVMMPVADRDGLQIRFATTGYSDDEKALVWRKGEGCVGAVLERPRIVKWPAEQHPTVTARLAESLSTEQQRHTSHVKMVIAVPIYDRNDGPNGAGLLAVMALDDTVPPGDDQLLVWRVAETVATQVQERVRQLVALEG